MVLLEGVDLPSNNDQAAALAFGTSWWKIRNLQSSCRLHNPPGTAGYLFCSVFGKEIISMTHSEPITYIPLKHAAEKYGIPEKTLLDHVKSGSIASAQLPNGELLVAETNVDSSLKIKRKDYKHLHNQPISASEASRKYSQIHNISISQRIFSRWAELKYITVLERGYRLLLDEADVAYCAAVYKAKHDLYRGRMSGVRIFDEAGNPYELKYPEVAARLRAERRQDRKRQQHPKRR
jgi:hypothetical protein